MIFFSSFLFFFFSFLIFFFTHTGWSALWYSKVFVLRMGRASQTIRVSYGVRSHAGEGLRSPVSLFLLTQRCVFSFFGLLLKSQSFWLYKISLTWIICHLARIIKWWLSDQLPLWYSLCISINGFEGQLCKCNLCVTLYSFVLCRKNLCSSCNNLH